MPRTAHEIATIALGELQMRVIVLTAEKELLEAGIEKLKANIAAHRCDGPPIKDS